MLGKVLRGVRRQLGLRFIALGAWSLCALTSATAAAQPALFNAGVRWLGSAPACAAPPGWMTQRLFASPGLPSVLADLCTYTWTRAGGVAVPKPADITQLFSFSGARDLTEDVPVVMQSTLAAQQEALLVGLRTALRAHVGDVSLLPSMPASPLVRIVVIDSAPDAADGHIQPGTSRHGDTLAHLIEDLVCRRDAASRRRICAAEVTAALALEGGVGTLSDLARAIERAVSTWEADRRSAPSTTPARLILNLSLGWEDTPKIADCSTGPADLMGPAARGVLGILRYAAARGALIIAAAGNDAGGAVPRTGLLCPGRYQAMPRAAGSSDPLVVAVSGVDYQDRALQTARPAGITAITAIGLGGVAWNPADPVPSPLTGSSVSTAVVSAISALVWAHRPTWTPGEVTEAVYDGGVDVGAADECPHSFGSCRSHRASVCGALLAAGASPSCSPPPAGSGSSPALPGETAALQTAFAGLPPTIGTTSPPPATLPRHALPTIQVQPWVGPMPVAETCPVCVVSAAQLSVPSLEQQLQDPVLVMQFADGTEQAVALGPTTLATTTPYLFALPLSPTGAGLRAAYITGIVVLASQSFSVIEQIFVQP
jgi:hypothetical protein